MKKLTIAVAFVLLLATINIGIAQGPLKIIPADNGASTSTSTYEGSMISLTEAAARSNNNSSSPEPEMQSESVENADFIRNEISAGNKLFVKSIIDGIYTDFDNSSAEFGTMRGSIFTAITFVPNPYEDKGILELYGGYLNFSLYMTFYSFLGH